MNLGATPALAFAAPAASSTGKQEGSELLHVGYCGRTRSESRLLRPGDMRWTGHATLT